MPILLIPVWPVLQRNAVAYFGKLNRYYAIQEFNHFLSFRCFAAVQYGHSFDPLLPCSTLQWRGVFWYTDQLLRNSGIRSFSIVCFWLFSIISSILIKGSIKCVYLQLITIFRELLWLISVARGFAWKTWNLKLSIDANGYPENS